MKRLIYGSQAVTDFSPEELLGVLASARRRNTAVGVTGMLLYSGRSFLQLLEGEPGAVQEIYARIVEDRRHTRLRILMDADVGERLFSDWSMAFKHLAEADLAAGISGYMPSTTYPLLNPAYIKDGAVAETLLGLYARDTSGDRPMIGR